MEDEDEVFERLREGLGMLFDEETLAAVKALNERWLKIGGLISSLDLTNTALEADWVQEGLKEYGIHIDALLLMGLRIAISKNEPPMNFSATYTSGFVLGYVSCLEDQGTPVLDQMLERRPEPGEELPIGLMRVETRPYESPMNIDDLGEHLRTTAREVASQFTEPDDDWVPVLIVSCEKEMSLVNFEIPNEGMKTHLFEFAIPHAVKKTMPPAQAVGFVVSAWTLENEEGIPQRPLHGQIKDHPDRTETLIVYLMDREGNTQMWSAKILRDDEHPPGLDEWKLHDIDLSTGRVSDMLRKIVS